MSAEFFMDTNVLVYTSDHGHPEKRALANEIVERAVSSRRGVISFQVVQEFLNVALTKFERPLSIDDASQYLEQVLDPLCAVFSSAHLYRRTLAIRERWRFSFYHSLIVAAALESECETLYSEDLQHEQRVESLTIVNPFLRASAS
jgi:predicted nucleic acid-binding protein